METIPVRGVATFVTRCFMPVSSFPCRPPTEKTACYTGRDYMSKGESWSGRLCCTLPHSESCRTACITATSPSDLVHGCRQSDEIPFYNCLERQKNGEECCRNARSNECQETCLEVYRSHMTPTKAQRNQIKEYCENSSPKVTECVKDLVKVTVVTNTSKHMHCCDKSNKIQCREACKIILSTKNVFQEIIDSLEVGGCGIPSLQDYFWQCFLRPDSEPNLTSIQVSRIERVGMDSAKWHCCQRASSTACNRLCSKTFTKYLATSWDEFNNKCLSQISEENLRNCIDEMEEPCELGCDGLSFCTNFNNRPTELFRSCKSEADEAARSDVTLWQNDNNLTLPGLVLPLKTNSKCSQEMWKSVACTLQIKPCSRNTHGNQICREDCMEILSECVDWSRLYSNPHSKVTPRHSAESICDTLSPEDPTASCIRLQDYRIPSEYNQRITGQVTSPCKGNPCEENEICLINKNCILGTNCQPFTCVPGCKLGEVSDYMVPEGTYVRIPIPNKHGYLKICKCQKNKIEDCQPLPRVNFIPCLLGSRQELHNSYFNIDCNYCSCYAGEIVCSKKQCENGELSGRNAAYTTLPCNCPPHYVPVCGRNGITYPSACLAKCAGLSDSDIEEHYPCQNPCKPNMCPVGQKCVPHPQICLSLVHKPCTQHECINGTANCSHLPRDPVCDIDNNQYDNSCLLAHHNAKLAYRGPCLNRCKYKGQVCGINGKTYLSECAALADYVSVDYEGPCITLGFITEDKSIACVNVKCAPLVDQNCFGITPPGACCPICGGALRILYSRKQIDRGLYALQSQYFKPLNLQTTLKALERQIQLAQCALRGYVSIEQDLFVAVQSTEKNPSDIQLETCVREAEKIANLINNHSPRVESELSLSSLISATIIHTDVSSGVVGIVLSNALLVLTIFVEISVL
ncbi:reversion-inducing cysteine-rich protein with Kazal motifs isoform X2 [Aethina tumida]|uniref:reversion-inducing cysteine-rich protein with Kazal motifs isoform X2 n=1 Tax=Aethina tumida TaxID=116153 RepID=UPI002148245E|nr:reversion-inducing cysteine-rich protein with Kazal motifs isoform X2 [Aethina tumida]